MAERLKKNIKEDKIIKAMHEYIDQCDCDEFSALAGFIFGGEFKVDFSIDVLDRENTYVLTDNDQYAGEFGFPDKKEGWY